MKGPEMQATSKQPDRAQRAARAGAVCADAAPAKGASARGATGHGAPAHGAPADTEAVPRPRRSRAMHALLGAALVLAQLGAAPRAHAENYGDWTVAVGKQLRIAHTSNELATVGFGCVGDDDCFAYVSSLVTPCTEGESTALLLNSAAGSTSTRAVCKRINGELIDVFDDMEALNSIAFKDEVFRLVVPLANGSFQISSFSSRGAMAALRTLSTAQPSRESRAADGLI